MKLSKNAVRILLFAGIAMICFNVIAFVVPFTKTGTFWIGYGFGMLAILLQLVVMKVAFHGTESVRSKFYGFPIARIGVIYGICQIILSITAMALSVFIPSGFRWSFLSSCLQLPPPDVLPQMLCVRR